MLKEKRQTIEMC